MGGIIFLSIMAGVFKILIIVVLVLCLPLNSIFSTGIGTGTGILSDTFSSKLQAIQSIIGSQFIFEQDQDHEDAMIKAYVDSFDDPYTVYYSPEEYRAMIESVQGEFYGIGVSIQMNPDTKDKEIIKVMEGSAKEAGVLAGDIFKKVNGEDVTNMDLDSMVTLVRGELGTEVTVTLYRPSDGQLHDFTMKRVKVVLDVAFYEMDDDGETGYIFLSSFSSSTVTQVKEAYLDLKSEGMTRLIFDVRGNGGGLFDAAVDLADLFLPEGVVTYTQGKDENPTYYKSDSFTILDVPMVLLIDENSASSSEVFAGAMKYYGAAKLVGTQSFGKGIVQTIYGLYDGSALKVTSARYYTPGGECIHEVGITPDVVSELADDATEDTQYLEALKVLQEMEK